MNLLKGLIDTNRTLNEIARLRKQRQILVCHLRTRTLMCRYLEKGVLRVGEERDHLRNELESEKVASRASLTAMQADLNAARAEAHDMDKKWRQALEDQCQAIVERDEAVASLRALETSNG